ncbi:MAG: heavy-metal-associated domain-containing protein [Bacteroidota bacterium]
MKTLKTIVLSFLLFSFGLFGCAQTAGTVEKTFKTSGQCGMCKDRIEKMLAYEKGIVSSDFNVETKELTVKYKSNKTNEAEIKKAVSKLGYDIDDVMGDQVAYEKLPPCCKKPSDPNHVKH